MPLLFSFWSLSPFLTTTYTPGERGTHTHTVCAARLPASWGANGQTCSSVPQHGHSLYLSLPSNFVLTHGHSARTFRRTQVQLDNTALKFWNSSEPFTHLRHLVLNPVNQSTAAYHTVYITSKWCSQIIPLDKGRKRTRSAC